MATPKFIQAQSFQIQASGASSGDTTLTIQSFKLPDGTTNITTSDLGDQCYGTLEPNNGTQEEAIQFTGVTQNAGGTATLTGVSSVGFKYPYTVTSGLSKSHAGGVTFILSNDAAFYGNIATYINNTAASGAALASDSIAGLTKLSVTAASGSNPIAVGTNDARVLSQTNANYVNSVVTTGIPYAVATGTSSAYTVTLASSVASLASGTSLNFLVPTTNATGITLNINSLGAKSLKKNYNVSLASGDIVAGQVISTVYDGTNFQIQNPVSGGFVGAVASGITTKNVADASATQNIAHGLGTIPKYIRILANEVTGTFGRFYEVDYTSSGVSYIYQQNSAGTPTKGSSTSAGIVFTDAGANGTQTGIVTADATNIIITWTKSSAPPSVTADIAWMAMA